MACGYCTGIFVISAKIVGQDCSSFENTLWRTPTNVYSSWLRRHRKFRTVFKSVHFLCLRNFKNLNRSTSSLYPGRIDPSSLTIQYPHPIYVTFTVPCSRRVTTVLLLITVDHRYWENCTLCICIKGIKVLGFEKKSFGIGYKGFGIGYNIFGIGYKGFGIWEKWLWDRV